MNRKIVEYTSVWAEKTSSLDLEVNSLIEEGFQPFGGLSCSQSVDSDGERIETLCQAMVKYEGEK